MSRIEEIEARLSATRPGRWLVNDEEQTVRVEHAEGGEWCGEIMYDRSAEHPTYWASEFRPDAVFIAAAPADIAYLLAELRDRDEKTEVSACAAGHHAVCQNRRIYQEPPSPCDCRCHTTRMVICAKCGLELPFEETNEHTRTHR